MKTNFNKILERLDYWKAVETKMQEAMTTFFETLAPDSYPPRLGVDLVHGFIDGAARGNDELEDWLEYYAYEAKENFTCKQGEVECNNAADPEQFAEFLDKVYNQ